MGTVAPPTATRVGRPLQELAATGVRAVVFDLNGVLTLPPSTVAERLLRRLAGLDEDTFEQLYWHHRSAYDRDELDSSGYWRRIGRDAGLRYDTERVGALVRMDAATWAKPNRPMVDTLIELDTAGIRTAILSNTPRDIWTYVSAKHPWTRVADVRTLSFEIGLAKPDPAVFGICLERLGAAPEETLFVDDREENVDAARRLGIRTDHYRLDRCLS